MTGRRRSRPAFLPATLLPAILVLAALLPLAGCRTDSGPPPILSVERSDCTAQPETARAVPLPLEKRQDPQDSGRLEADRPLSLTIDRSSPCLDLGAAGRSLYALVALPGAAESYIVRVAAQPSEHGLFSPHLVLLDDAGARLREIDRESFLFRGSRLTAQFWAHPEERYLVVASDPAGVGKQVDRLASQANTTVVGLPGGVFYLGAGSDRRVELTYSYGGVVTLQAVPPASAAPPE